MARIARAALFALAAWIGLALLGAEWRATWPIVMAVAALMLLGALAGLVSAAAAVLLVWGALVTAGIAPGPGAVAAMTTRTLASLEAGAAPSGRADAPKPAPLADRLAALNDLCGAALLTAKECADARARVLDALAGPAKAADAKR